MKRQELKEKKREGAFYRQLEYLKLTTQQKIERIKTRRGNSAKELTKLLKKGN